MTGPRPNILFVFSDQQRATALGCAGVEDVRTPHLDRFAATGTRFTNAVANNPCCCPSRASLLTGRHTLSHGVVVNDIPLRTDLPTLARGFNQVGYRCGYIGKWHLDGPDRGGFVPPGPRRQGFDDFWAVANCNHDYLNAHYYLNDDPAPFWFEDYEPFAQTDLAVEYLQTRAGHQPFCLVLSFGPPHCPYLTAPAEFQEPYRAGRFRLLPNTTESAVREIIAGYYAHVSALDHCFGRLIAALDQLQLSANTLVIFTSDHGDMLFSHNRGWKCKPWRESVGIPLLMRWPGCIPGGRVTNGPIGIVDLMPTLLGLAGAKIPAGVEGRNLSAFVCGEESAAPPDQYINFPVVAEAYSFPAWRGVVTRTHTYVRTREEPWLLYEDEVDPFQLRNRVTEPACAPLRRQLEERVLAWMHLTGDRFSTSCELADRFAPGHSENVVPYYYNETIINGSKDRSLRRSRPAGMNPA